MNAPNSFILPLKDSIFFSCLNVFSYSSIICVIFSFRNYFVMVKKYIFSKDDGHGQNSVVCKELLVTALSTL